MKPCAICIVISSIPFPLVDKQYKKYQCIMYNIVQEYLYFHGTRTQKVLLIVTVGRGISSKSDTNLFQGFLFTIPFQPVSLNKKMCTLYVAS